MFTRYIINFANRVERYYLAPLLSKKLLPELNYNNQTPISCFAIGYMHSIQFLFFYDNIFSRSVRVFDFCTRILCSFCLLQILLLWPLWECQGYYLWCTQRKMSEFKEGERETQLGCRIDRATSLLLGSRFYVAHVTSLYSK